VIGLFDDRDMVSVDSSDRPLDVGLTDDELNYRYSDWKQLEMNDSGTVLAKYSRDFGSAANDAAPTPSAPNREPLRAWFFQEIRWCEWIPTDYLLRRQIERFRGCTDSNRERGS